MDTRTKILTSGAALEKLRGRPVTAVIGYFDVLQASHVRALRELHHENEALAAVVIDPPDPLLPRRARQELVAALDIIDFVIPADVLEPLNARIVHQEQADAERTRQLILHVQQRYQ